MGNQTMWETIHQAMSGSEMSRIGQVVNVELRNGSKIVTIMMKVANLLGGYRSWLVEVIGIQIEEYTYLFPKDKKKMWTSMEKSLGK